MLQNGILVDGTVVLPMAVWIGAIALIVVIIPYLLGSINTAVLISRVFYGADIRTQGSGNAGLTNMLRVNGKKAALWVLLGDVLKMLLSLLIAGMFFGMQYGPYAISESPFVYLAGVACILGHIFPIYFKFKGGKGVLCTAAMVLVLSPIVFGIEILIFILLLVVTHFVSVASMTVGLLYPLVLNRVMVFLGYPVMDGIIMLVTILVAFLIFYCHRSNIVRIREKRENRFYFRKKKAEEVKARLAAEEAARAAAQKKNGKK